MKKYVHSMSIAALFTVAKIWKQPKCPSADEWIKKPWYIYTMKCYSAIEKNEITTFVTAWMDLEGITLSETSQTEKANTMRFHYMWSLKDKTNKQNRNRHIESRLMVAREKAAWGRANGKGEGIRKNRLVGAERSQWSEVQRGEHGH